LPFWSTSHMVHPFWTTREQEIEGKTRERRWCLNKFLQKKAPWTTAVVDDAALIPLLPSLLFHVLSSVHAGARQLGLLGMDTETQRATLLKRKKNRRPGLGRGKGIGVHHALQVVVTVGSFFLFPHFAAWAT
jgi:hypothetical protein